jgi:hypothetical protein
MAFDIVGDDRFEGPGADMKSNFFAFNVAILQALQAPPIKMQTGSRRRDRSCRKPV